MSELQAVLKGLRDTTAQSIKSLYYLPENQQNMLATLHLPKHSNLPLPQ